MSTRYEQDGTALRATHRVCDRCKKLRHMYTPGGMPMKWMLADGLPPGWRRVETVDCVRHYCKDCWSG